MNKVWKLLYFSWMKFAKLLGFLNTRLLLFLTYVFLVGPIAILFKIFRKDLLDRKITPHPSYWKDKPPENATVERSKYQF